MTRRLLSRISVEIARQYKLNHALSKIAIAGETIAGSADDRVSASQRSSEFGPHRGEESAGRCVPWYRVAGATPAHFLSYFASCALAVLLLLLMLSLPPETLIFPKPSLAF